jgi:hypothetical protein
MGTVTLAAEEGKEGMAILPYATPKKATGRGNIKFLPWLNVCFPKTLHAVIKGWYGGRVEGASVRK